MQKLKKGDTVYVACKVEAVYVDSGLMQVSTRYENFDAYEDEVLEPSEFSGDESVLDKIYADIDIARFIDKDTKLCKNANASGLEVAMQIIDKYNKDLPPVAPTQEPVLDQIRAEIGECGSIKVTYAITDDTKTDKGIEKLVSDVLKQAKEQVLDIIDEHKTETTNPTTLAQERYQDLIDYFGDKETAKIILEDREEFKAWLERLEWHVKKADELARELEQLQKKNI